jgi:Protein of unknown function (DUF1353)
MSTFLTPLPVLTRPLGECRAYRLTGTLRHADGDVVPDGYHTDLASVPRLLHWLIPPDGPYEAAAVRHDRRCDAHNRGEDCGTTPRETDRDFRRDLRALGMGPVRAWTAWLGVRLGALTNPHRRPGSLATLPGVLLLLLLHLWVLIPTLFVAAAVLLLDLIEPGSPRPPAAVTPGRHDEHAVAA